jgi:hypothetical protein
MPYVSHSRPVGDIDHICQLAGNLIEAPIADRECKPADLFQQPLPNLNKIPRRRGGPIRSSQSQRLHEIREPARSACRSC